MLGIYCRVSTDGQVDGTSLDTQEQAGKRFAGIDPYKVYRDEGISGGTFNRPKFEELVQDIQTKLIDRLWVLDFDRLSRARPGDLDNFFIFLEKHSIKLYVNGIYQPLDDPEQMLSPYLMGILAYIERTKIKKRTKRGKIAAKNEGKATFSDAYGYTQVLRNGKKVWTIVPEEAEVIKTIYKMYISGKTQRQIEFYLKDNRVPCRSGSWFRPIISRLLSRLYYAGKTKDVAGNIIDSVSIPAIVSWEDYQKVLEIAASRNCRLADRRVGQKLIRYACSAIVKCRVCGKSWVHKRKTNVEYYSCQHDPSCTETRSYIQRDIFETIIYYDTTRLLLSYIEIEKILHEQLNNIKETQTYNKTLIENLQVSIEKQEIKKKRLVNAIAEGVVNIQDAKGNMEEINREIKEIKEQIEAIEKRMQAEVEDAELLLAKFSSTSCDELNELIIQNKENELNTFLKKYVKSALFSDNVLELEFVTGKIVKRWVPRKLVAAL